MTQVFKFVLSGVFALSGLPVYADGTPTATPQLKCGQALVNSCQNKALAVGAKYKFDLSNIQGGMKGNATDLSSSSANASAALGGVADECAKSANQCANGCTVPQAQRQAAINQCKKVLGEMSAEYKSGAASLAGTAGDAASTATAAQGDTNEGPVAGSGGGGMGMLGTAALAAGAGLLGYMMGKKGKDKKDEEEDGALQANGTLNCAKDDAYEYMDCNPYLSQACSAKMLSNTYAGDKACQNFASRFCGSGTASSSAATTVSLSSSNGSPAKGAVGEGLSQNPGFCQSVLAFNFCQGSGRTECPSCLQLKANQAPACLNNPALCLAQNSADQINQAKTTCPTDPVFANPDMLKSGSQVATEIAGGAPLPVATLPSGTGSQQVVNAGTGSSGTTVATTGGAGGTQVAANTGGSQAAGGTVVTFSTASVNGGGGAREAAVREGGGGGVNSQAAYGGGGSGMNPVHHGLASGSGREIAMAGGAAGSMRPSNVGPASDVQGQYGPSVFAMGTQVYRQRCQAGKLNNCP